MKSNTIIAAVADLIANTLCREGVANHIVQHAGRGFGISGTDQLRKLAKMFRCIYGGGVYAYLYSHNRYFPTREFKDFCRRYARTNS